MTAFQIMDTYVYEVWCQTNSCISKDLAAHVKICYNKAGKNNDEFNPWTVSNDWVAHGATKVSVLAIPVSYFTPQEWQVGNEIKTW